MRPDRYPWAPPPTVRPPLRGCATPLGHEQSPCLLVEGVFSQRLFLVIIDQPHCKTIEQIRADLDPAKLTPTRMPRPKVVGRQSVVVVAIYMLVVLQYALGVLEAGPLQVSPPTLVKGLADGLWIGGEYLIERSCVEGNPGLPPPPFPPHRGPW